MGGRLPQLQVSVRLLLLSCRTRWSESLGGKKDGGRVTPDLC